MINRKTVFVLGAGASCSYGYPSGARLRERICLSQGLWQDYNAYNLPDFSDTAKVFKLKQIEEFKNAFNKSRIKSIDLFMANNTKLAPIGKYIIAFEIFRAERQSLFGEEAKFEQEQTAYLQNHGLRGPSDLFPRPLFLGEDWYSYLYNRLIEGLVGEDALPDFSNGNLSFITFNYDRSLEQFLYESLSNSFTEVPEADIITCLRKLKILHVYGQIAPLKWQDWKQGLDYRPQISETLLQKTAANIKTIYEQRASADLDEARVLLAQASRVFFLGFGYAQENREVLDLPSILSNNCFVYGTAFGLRDSEVDRIRKKMTSFKTKTPYVPVPSRLEIRDEDCLVLLKDYFE